jgi:hypothetical protein
VFQSELFLSPFQQLLQLLPTAGCFNLLLQQLPHRSMADAVRPM